MNIRIFLSTVIATAILSFDAIAQNITGMTTLWYNTFSNSTGGFGRGIIDNNNLVISGLTWPTYPSGTRDQMISKINPQGNIVFQTVRAPGGDHDFYISAIKLQNGNYSFFGQQNAQGTQYFDAFYTEFDTNGVEVSYNYFSIPGYSNGTDMQALPNGNIVFTGNHGGGQFLALTSQIFTQLNYQTFAGAGWVQLGIDTLNNNIFGIVSESNSTSIKIVKYDFSLNFINSYDIPNAEGIMNYDVKMDGSDLLLCGYKLINGQKFGSYHRFQNDGTIAESFLAQNVSEFTAIEKYGTQIILAKSNLSGLNSISNELNVFNETGMLSVSHTLNSSSPFVPYDLILNGDTIYAIGAQGSGYWIGIPAVEKILISDEYFGCTNNQACNYNSSATQDDGTCTFPNQSYLNCDGGCNNDSNGNGICDEIESSNTATSTVRAGISYQAVARNAQGQPLSDAVVQVKFTLLTDSLTGAAEYSESHSLTTNSLGLFTTAFGAGTPETGTFAGINWASGIKYLKVELDAGDGFVDMGTQQLLSVPFSMRSNTSAKAGTIENAGLPVYADNAAALAGGLIAGQMYRTATGDLKIVY